MTRASEGDAQVPRRARGFSLVELAIAMTVTAMVIGAAFALVSPSQAMFQVQPEAADLQQRVRAAVDALQGDVMGAGAGIDSGRSAGPLSDHVAAVLPYRAGDVNGDVAAGRFFRPDAITVLSVTSIQAQAAVTHATIVGTQLVVDAVPNCGGVPFDRVCGFSPGTRVILFDPGGAWDLGSVNTIVGATLLVDHVGPMSSSHDSGDATIAAIDVHTYYSKPDPSTGAHQLVHYDGHVTDMPVVDHLVGLQFEYFGDPSPPMLLPGVDLHAEQGPWTTYGPKPPPAGVDDPVDGWPAGENCTFALVEGMQVPRLTALPGAFSSVRLDPSMLSDGPWCPDAASPGRFDADLLRIRRVRVVLRFEAAADSLRGPASALFARGGTSTSAQRLVPDVEVRFDVTPRNLNLAR